MTSSQAAIENYLKHYGRINIKDMCEFFGTTKYDKRFPIYQQWEKIFRERGLDCKGYNVKL